jgi:hypothetical protein
MNIPFVSTIELVLQTTHPKTSISGGSPKLRNTYFVMGQLKRLVTEIKKIIKISPTYLLIVCATQF